MTTIAKLRSRLYRIKVDFLTWENLILLLGLLLCLCWAWSAIVTASRNWDLENQLVSRHREQTLLELETETMEYDQLYLQSEEYLEIAARKYQGKMLAGETMLALPDNSPAARDKYKSTDTSTEQLSNFQQWLRFLFG